MTMPSVVNSNATFAGNNQTQADVSLTVSSSTGRVIFGLPTIVDSASSISVTSVTFDPGGTYEASLTEETGARAIANLGFTIVSGVWYLALSDSVPNGSYTIRAVFSEVASRSTMAAWETNNTDTTDPIGATGTGTGNSDTLSVEVTTGATNSLVGMSGTGSNNMTFTPGTGDTEQTETSAANQSTWSGHTPAATTGTYEVSCVTSRSPSTDQWAASGFEIKEAAAAGAPPPRIRPLRFWKR